MNLNAIKNRLALLQAGGVDSDNVAFAGVTGVKRAYAEAPAALPESDLPLFVNMSGPTRSFLNMGGDYYRESRVFNCRLYVVPVTAGIDGEAERKVEPFIELCMRRFLAYQSLGDGNRDDFISGVFTVEYIGDTGVQVLRYAGTDYLGVEFRVAVDAVIEQAEAYLE